MHNDNVTYYTLPNGKRSCITANVAVAIANNGPSAVPTPLITTRRWNMTSSCS